MNGLPAIANNLAAKGRYGDSMLMHVSPGEVKGLQSLAMANGGSLTINPDTGLPEAFKLKDILPTLIGVGASFLMPGVAPWMIGAGVGGAEALRTGDLGRGLMAGLGAFGGAGLGSAFGAGAASGAAPIADATLAQGAQTVSGLTAQAPSVASLGNLGISDIGSAAGSSVGSPGIAGMTTRGFGMGANATPAITTPATVAGPAAGGTPPTFFERYTTAMENPFVSGKTGALAGGFGMAAPLMPGPEPLALPEEEKFDYKGPYTPTKRRVSYPGDLSSREFNYFSPSNPVPFADGGDVVDRSIKTPDAGYAAGTAPEFNYGFRPVEIASPAVSAPPASIGGKGGIISRLIQQIKNKQSGAVDMNGYKYDPQTQQLVQMARGGSVPQLEDGGFVLTKKAVDGIGGGSNKKGQQVASKGLGALPIKGKGTGTSDSIKTTIDGKVPALVSNGEAYIPKRNVKKAGGADKLYALMKKAERRA